LNFPLVQSAETLNPPPLSTQFVLLQSLRLRLRGGRRSGMTDGAHLLISPLRGAQRRVSGCSAAAHIPLRIGQTGT
jgi:hypothetical protein